MKSFPQFPSPPLILISHHLQDPSCAWDILNNKCTLHSGSPSDASGLLQNLAEGFHAGCGGAAGSVRQGENFFRLSTTLPTQATLTFFFSSFNNLSTFSLFQVCPRACPTT